MRTPLSWLKDYVDIPIPVEELAQRLTFAGLEVEGIEYIGVTAHGAQGSQNGHLAWDRDKIFVGQILEIKPHPNADRLTLAVVDYGHGEPIQVVTGAPNIHVGEKGQKVALALEGSRLYDGHKPGQELMTLKKSKIRGIESGSMVCSEKELGLSDEHEGIILLPDDAPVGAPLADYLGDVIFDIKINPNFARSQSVLGIAREVAALTDQSLKDNATPVNEPAGLAETDYVRIEIADSRLCARYSAALIRDVEIKPSPFWMRRRLELAGQRPISNIVDITNYVMIAIGQPLHAFDYDRLAARAHGKPTIVVRSARQGEKMQTLDGAQREFKPTDLLITDMAGPIAIAGIMGGAETEVSETTKNILLEAANFDFISIRRTMQEQKLPSEAATRFGRGIHPSSTIPCLQRAAALMHDLGGGKVDAMLADNYPTPVIEPTIDLTLHEVTRLLGIELSAVEITHILQSLDFQVIEKAPDRLAVTPPDYRLDVDGTDDVIEEIVRIYGYDRVPSALIADELPPQQNNVELDREEQARDLLVNLELQEVITYTMTTPAHEALLTPQSSSPAPGLKSVEERGSPRPNGEEGKGAEPAGSEFDPRPARPYIEIENPISADRTVLRQSLLPSVLDVLASNLRYTSRAALFEIGKVYIDRRESGANLTRLSEEELEAQLPLEKKRLAIILTGSREIPTWRLEGPQLGQGADTAPTDFFDLKGVVQEFVSGLYLPNVDYVPSTNTIFHPGRAAALRLGEKHVGVFGELHPLVRERFDLPEQSILVGEFDLEAILAQVQSLFIVKPLSRYPAVIQDIALIVDSGLPAGRVEALIRQTGGPLLVGVWLFDVYEGEPLPPGKKSLAYRLTFQAIDRGLSDADAGKLREKIVQRLKREVGAELRSG